MAYLDDIIKYYKDLLIIQYHNKQKAKNTIGLLAKTAVGDSIYKDLQNCFDLETAKGEQLDILGKIIGAPRSGLSDSDYKILLKFKIVWNNLDARMKSIDDIMFDFFGNAVNVSNNRDMTITYIIQQNYSEIIDIANKLGFLASPNGVGATKVVLTPLPDHIFGFNTKYDSATPVGFSNKEENRMGTFLTKENIV